MRARCRAQSFNGVQYGDLTLGNVYRVLGIEADDLRIISDEGRPYLFPPELFEIVDSSPEPDWVTRSEAGSFYAYAPELGAPGFFEDYFNDVPTAVGTFRQYVSKLFRRG